MMTARTKRNSNRLFILKYLGDHGPSSCVDIRKALAAYNGKTGQISRHYYFWYFDVGRFAWNCPPMKWGLWKQCGTQKETVWCLTPKGEQEYNLEEMYRLSYVPEEHSLDEMARLCWEANKVAPVQNVDVTDVPVISLGDED